MRLAAVVITVLLSVAGLLAVGFAAPDLWRLVLGSGFGSRAVAATVTPGLSTVGGPRFFVLGVWVQPVGLMETWKARGVNTVVQAPEGHDVLKWSQAADVQGLYQIRQPSADLSHDLENPHLLAWASHDEPSNNSIGALRYGVVAQDPAELAAEVEPLRAAAAAAGKSIPIWTNHVANHIWPSYAQHNTLMRDYMEGKESDWLAADAYPIQERQPFVVESSEGYTSTVQSIALDRQIAWSSGKPVMTFIGTSAYKPNAPVPTAEQFSAIAWSAVIHGASGVVYFPVVLTPFAFDATPSTLVTALTTFNREVSSINGILMDQTRGGRRPYVVFRSANKGQAAKADQLPYPFEAAVIQSSAGAYRIILNLSDTAQVLNKPDWGLSQVKFQPYAVLKKPS